MNDVELIHPWDVYELLMSVPEIERDVFKGHCTTNGSDFVFKGKTYRQTAGVEPKTTNIR